MDKLKSVRLLDASTNGFAEKRSSTPLLRQRTLAGLEAGAAADGLRDESSISLKFGDECLPVLPSPWVRNGPPDQTDFHKKVLQLQLKGLSKLKPRDLALRYSMVESIDGSGKTAQFLLEQPKPIAMAWNSNYGSHGWHRYVGRFPPHLIRSLLNSFGADSSTLVCDPFLGSGTTAVECRLLGIPFVGIEICPLSCLISRAKSKFPRDTKTLKPLVETYTRFSSDRHTAFAGADKGSNIAHTEILARPGNLIPNFSNIERWFTPEALLGTSIALEFGMSLTGFAKAAFLTALSSKMRSIGNVDVDVVRAEYSRKPREGVNVAALVAHQFQRIVHDVEVMNRTHGPFIGRSESIEIREASVLDVELPRNSVSHMITSPPYGVEALSYLRTHLLSYRTLVAELLHDPYETRNKTIGSEYMPESREIDVTRIDKCSPTFRRFFREIKVDESLLNRKNAMMHFFCDLHLVGDKIARWLKPNGQVAFIIGNKRLDKDVIPADTIIGELFAVCGLHLEQAIRHKLKTNNSNSSVPWQERIIQEESILIFRKKLLRR